MGRRKLRPAKPVSPQAKPVDAEADESEGVVSMAIEEQAGAQSSSENMAIVHHLPTTTISDHTSADYYFDSYSHFGKPISQCLFPISVFLRAT